MKCPEVQVLEDLVGEALDADVRSELDEHLSHCGACRERLEEVRGNLEMIPSVRRVLDQAGRSPMSPPCPAVIGPFRILREVGRGGMGIVYEAEQTRPKRTVALKVINVGYASAEALRRFEHEAQALGRLQHPGIAQMFEAGTAATGIGPQPYFAMEYVRGPALLDFAERHGLHWRRRLDVFCGVCDAVQHAHQKGIIHRDLKPANILVVEPTEPVEKGGRTRFGQPKVLDFGVARIIDPEFHTRTTHTSAGQLIGTIPYMSPEQAGADPDALDTRSDVYALGVILYELLTHRLPYELDRRSLPEAVRVIQETDPLPCGSVNRHFRGDVETIVGKALEKDKTRRYQSAAELASDIQRFLRDEPIVARPASALYQLRKFARRHRGLVAGSTLVSVAVLLGALISTWQAVRATRAEARATLAKQVAEEAGALATERARLAQLEADKSRAVTEFLQEMLGSVDPSGPAGDRDMTVREALDRAAAKIEGGALVDQPAIEAAVRFTLGNTYRSLGDSSLAEPQLRRCLELRQALAPDGDAETALTLNKLARTVEEKGDYEQAESLFREALSLRRRLFGPEHAEVSTILNNLGWLLHVRGRDDEAEPMLREALAIRRAVPGHESTEVASTLNNLAGVYYSRRDLVQAEAMFRESLVMDRKIRGADHPNIASTMNNLALVLKERGEHAQAEALLREVLALQQKLLGPEHPQVAQVLNNLAGTVYSQGLAEQAETLFHEALALAQKVHGDRHPATARTMHQLAFVLEQRGDLDRAEWMYGQALAIRREKLGDDHPEALSTGTNLARLYLNRGKVVQAEPLFAEAVALVRRSPERHGTRLATYLIGHGKCLIRLGRCDEAEGVLRDAREVFDGGGASAAAVQELTDVLAELQKASSAAPERNDPADRTGSSPSTGPGAGGGS